MCVCVCVCVRARVVDCGIPEGVLVLRSPSPPPLSSHFTMSWVCDHTGQCKSCSRRRTTIDARAMARDCECGGEGTWERVSQWRGSDRKSDPDAFQIRRTDERSFKQW